ncbi:hypothetical protein BSFA1_87090 (plasmid) [Burkholderia sp. SFA1]|nr:hypothetical protein BSFA1_87090 [Burkholderia sp. SFA1]
MFQSALADYSDESRIDSLRTTTSVGDDGQDWKCHRKSEELNFQRINAASGSLDDCSERIVQTSRGRRPAAINVRLILTLLAFAE